MNPRSGGVLLAAISLVVALAVVAGFLAIGSPREERLRDLDRKRVESLRELAQTIGVNYRDGEANRELPESLADSTLTRSLGARYDDPVTRKPFEYRKLGTDRFELCATFDTESKESALETWESGWGHPAGRACFEFKLGAVLMQSGVIRPIAVRPKASPALPPIRPSGAR